MNIKDNTGARSAGKTAERSLEISQLLPASPRRVFEAWLDPEALSAFIRPQGNVKIPKAEVDARVGGRFLIVMRIGTQDIPHHGEYRELEPYSRLVFTWHSAHTAPESLVTITLEDLGEHRTRLTLHHVGFPNDEYRGNHLRGWTAIAASLETLLSSG